MDYSPCRLCPRQCAVDRAAGALGYCRQGRLKVARAMLHRWEEPVISGKGGSGAVFFSGCTLGCRYCQNEAISHGGLGIPITPHTLRRVFLDLVEQGAENIDLITPTQFLPEILPALEPGLPVPVCFNSGGYERVETIRALDGKVDVYLPDLKYMDPALSARLSGAADYPQAAAAAIRAMAEQVGPPVIEDGLLRRGVLIRHLILPGQVENSLKVLDWIGSTFAPGQVLVSLMRQYTPMPAVADLPPLNRTVTDEEYQAVLSWMYLNDLEGFVQEADAAGTDCIPDFTGWSPLVDPE